MKDKIKILCPGIELGNDEVRQIVKPGIMNSDKCELILSSFFGFRLIDKSDMANKFKQNGGLWFGPSTMKHPQPGLGTYTEHLPDGRLAEPLWIPYEEDDIDVVLLHGSGNQDKFKSIAEHYKHVPIINIDYKDVPIEKMFVEILNRNNVFNFKRSMVNLNTKNRDERALVKYPYNVHHTAFCVREDILEQQNMINKRYHDRQLDLACFFPPHEGDKWNRNAACRTWIGSVTEQYSESLNVHIGYTHDKKTSPQEEGRQGHDIDKPGSTLNKYIQTMNDSKIIITACPGNYEGDYRLMESMTSGALVMHNKMLLPPHGLVEDKHWVVYDSVEDLEKKITYYTNNPGKATKIANDGRKFVLENHRPHHRVEQWLKVAGLL